MQRPVRRGISPWKTCDDFSFLSCSDLYLVLIIFSVEIDVSFV